MFGFIVFLHVVVCILLAAIILMQSGRGGGLTESFSAAESMFGAKTNIVLIKGTIILSSFFLITCLGLAFLSSRSGKSLIEEKAPGQQEAQIPNKEIEPVPSTDTQKTSENANQEKNETAVTIPGEPQKPQ